MPETNSEGKQMTTPRLNAEPATRYFTDDTLKCWTRSMHSNNDEWSLMHYPSFNNPDLEYYVGHVPPPVKRTLTLTVNGKEWVLPEPLKVPFHVGRAYYVMGEDGRPSLRVWAHTDFDRLCQSKLRMSATEAECQAWADFDKWCRGGGA